MVEDASGDRFPSPRPRGGRPPVSSTPFVPDQCVCNQPLNHVFAEPVQTHMVG
jgi:hypothetical protein